MAVIGCLTDPPQPGPGHRKRSRSWSAEQRWATVSGIHRMEEFKAMPAKSNPGPVIRAIRQRLGLTQAKMAAQLGVSPMYLSAVEGGKKVPKASLVFKVMAMWEGRDR
jgi:DNA-binding XRE family transcriptional regulator